MLDLFVKVPSSDDVAPATFRLRKNCSPSVDPKYFADRSAPARRKYVLVT